jgi:chromate transporter
MSAKEFADLFAISQAAPGPNMLFVALVGWKAAGLAGALVSTVAMCAPSCLLTYGVNRVWHRFRGARWRDALLAGLAPVTIGIVLSSGYILTRAADHKLAAFGLTAATAIVVLTSRLNPLWMLAGGGLLGILGVV